MVESRRFRRHSRFQVVELFLRQDRRNLHTRMCWLKSSKKNLDHVFAEKRGHPRFTDAVKVQNGLSWFPVAWCPLTRKSIFLTLAQSIETEFSNFPVHSPTSEALLNKKPLSPFEIWILLQIKSLSIAVCEGPSKWRTSKTRSDFKCFCCTSALKTAISSRKGVQLSKHGSSNGRCRTLCGLAGLAAAIAE